MQPTEATSLDDALQAARWIASRPRGKAGQDDLLPVVQQRPPVRTVGVGGKLPFEPHTVPLFHTPSTTADDLEHFASVYAAVTETSDFESEATHFTPIRPPSEELAQPGDPAIIIDRLSLSPRTPRATVRLFKHGGGRVAGKRGPTSGRQLDFARVGASAAR